MRIWDVIPETFFDLDASAIQERMQRIMDERVIDPQTRIVRHSNTDMASCLHNVGNFLRDSMVRFEREHPESRRAG